MGMPACQTTSCHTPVPVSPRCTTGWIALVSAALSGPSGLFSPLGPPSLRVRRRPHLGVSETQGAGTARRRSISPRCGSPADAVLRLGFIDALELALPPHYRVLQRLLPGDVIREHVGDNP